MISARKKARLIRHRDLLLFVRRELHAVMEVYPYPTGMKSMKERIYVNPSTNQKHGEEGGEGPER